jgi:glutathione S-transferase
MDRTTSAFVVAVISLCYGLILTSTVLISNSFARQRILFFSPSIMSQEEHPPEWTVLYHGAGSIKGRGEFLRLMLEDKGVSYVNSDENMYGPMGMMDCFRGSPEAVKALDTNWPTFFPPAIWHRPRNGDEWVCINQVSACMVYLAEVLGYAPSTAAERGRAESVMANALDYISEGRASFHPVENKASYSTQKEQGDLVSKEFSANRMLLWLAHFDKVVRKYGPTNPVAGGASVTYADFCLFHVLDATVHQFNTEVRRIEKVSHVHVGVVYTYIHHLFHFFPVRK